MASAAQLRRQIEATLARRAPEARLSLAPRLITPSLATGCETLDAVLRGGLPVSGTSEIIGPRSSGRASIAMAYLAQRTREGHVCAWIDVAGDLSPEAALTNGIDLDRVLWIRCSGTPEATPGTLSPQPSISMPALSGMHLVKQAFPQAKPNLRPHTPTRSRSIGTPGAPNRPLNQPSDARTVQIATDRLPSRRGALVVNRKPFETEPASPQPIPAPKPFTKPQKPWSRLEQAIKAVDLLVQAGGFGAIVLDLGTIAPQFARRIPLATWFRWRSALERSRSGLIVLSQSGCSGSSAELVLRVEAELPEQGTVLTGISYRLEVTRRRFEEASPGLHRKRPESASAWDSRATYAVSGQPAAAS